jgi:hypothetical protein
VGVEDANAANPSRRKRIAIVTLNPAVPATKARQSLEFARDRAWAESNTKTTSQIPRTGNR